MKSTSFNSRKPISVILFTKYKLIRSQISFLLENKSEIKIQDFAATPDDLLKKSAKKHPDVVLFCLMDDEIESIEVIPAFFEKSPDSKVIILASQNGKLDQTKVLELGATGIVGVHQREEVLIRAIRQVSDGEVCLNRQLVAQLLGNGSKSKSNHNGSEKNGDHRGIYKNDPLTDRELEVIKVMARGLTNKEISSELFISEATVRHHLSSIYSKLNVEDRLNLVIYAYQHNIVRASF